jgi:hypothetical protein
MCEGKSRLERVVESILTFRCVRAAVSGVLVRWAGCDASGDTWEPLETK